MEKIIKTYLILSAIFAIVSVLLLYHFGLNRPALAILVGAGFFGLLAMHEAEQK